MKDAKAKDTKEKEEPLHPNQIVRKSEGAKFFGYRHSQLDEVIKAGKIPAPIKLTESGRAVGWLGWQILEFQLKRLAAAETRPTRAKATA